MPASPPGPATWRRIRLGVHLLTALLLLLIVVRALTRDAGVHWPLLAAVLLMALVYTAGLAARVRRDRRFALTWLGLLVLAWVAVLALAPEGVYLAFPLFFLAGHLFGDRGAVITVAALTVLAVTGYAAHDTLTFAAVLGPVLGALVAVATILGLRAVQRESSRRGVLEERERLAREIHDTLAQGLSSINLLLGAAQQRLADDPARAGALVDEARQVATANLEEARRFVRALAPVGLDDPLVDALERTARSAGGSFTVSGEVRPLPSAYDVALLRITQEALTNARRHAGGQQLAVTLSFLDDAVLLDVVDDGVGFEPELARTGFGLSSMRARAEDVRGRLTVESAPGAGTAVAASLPLDVG